MNVNFEAIEKAWIKPKKEWKDIPNYEGLYQASTEGEIKSYYTGKILKQEISKNGYCKFMLCKNRKRKLYSVHRLIAMTFIENPNNYPIINHMDSNKTNNCVSNLEWCTQKYNMQHAYTYICIKPTWLGKKGKLHPSSVKIEQYDLNDNFIKTWNSMMDIKRILNIDCSNISKCCKGKYHTVGGYKWKYTKSKN